MVDTPRISCLGELLWDVFPDRQRLGGAPANVAFHAARLGAQASLQSRVGSDDLGDLALTELERAEVDVRAVERDATHPTGTVLVALERGEPSYTIVAPAAWDHISAPPAWLGRSEAPVPHALVFGSLAARSGPQALRLGSWLREARARAESRPRLIFDLNLRRPHVSLDFVRDAIGLVDLLKLNEAEFDWLSATGVGLVEPASTDRARADQLFARFAVGLIVVTRGDRGATLFSRDRTFDAPGIPTQVVDTVGAGDAFLAALLVALFSGEPPQACLDRANRCAAGVVAEGGAMGQA